MSQSPASVQDANQMDGYRAGWRATMQLIRQGRSFSGNEPNCAMLNTAAGSFANVASIMGLDYPDDGRAIGVVDWDQDGDLDLWYANRTGPRLRFMRNQWTEMSAPNVGSDYVAFQLEGTQSNRDAIGARVEVVLANDSPAGNRRPRRLIRALRAGEGYLSQSSKTLHFGLGHAAAIDHVRVRWPSGMEQRFTEIEPGRRYRLIEGQDYAESLAIRQIPLALPSKPQPEPPSPTTSRTLLATRIPLPILRYQTTVGTEPIELANSGRPQIITLWASWCPHCLEELADLQRHADQLRATGSEVMAWNVDALDISEQRESEAAKRRLAEMEFAHPSGFVVRETVDKLALLQSLIFSRQPPAAVPMTYLVDGEGKLAAIYQGRVEVKQLLADIRSLELSADAWRDQAVPFAGRWSRPPRELLTTAIARFYREAGYSEDYVRYLELDAQELERRMAAARSDEARQSWVERYAKAHFELGIELQANDDARAASDHFARVLTAMPDHQDARLNLGVLLAKSGERDAGIAHLQRVLEADPTSSIARMNLAAAWEAQGRFDLAAEQYRWLLEQDPGQTPLRTRWGRALIETRQFQDAVEQFTRVLDADPTELRALLCLTWLHATCVDDQVRDGAKAQQYANQLANTNRVQAPMMLDLLAAAAAEQGDFDRALTHVRKAQELLGSQSPGFMRDLREREATYGNRSAFRDVDGKYP